MGYMSVVDSHLNQSSISYRVVCMIASAVATQKVLEWEMNKGGEIIMCIREVVL